MASSSEARRTAAALLLRSGPPLLVVALVATAACVESGWTRCADGQVCPPGLSCDGVNHSCGLPGAECFGQRDLASCEGGTKHCMGGVCLSACGDQLLDGDEECEGTNFRGKTCDDYSKYGGQLACSAACQVDSSGCTGSCGDGLLDEERESCDPALDPGAPTCLSRGLDAGRLACRADCSEMTSDPCMRLGWKYQSSEEGQASGLFVDLWGTRDALVALVTPGGVRSASMDGVSGWEAVGIEGPSIRGNALWASSSRDIWVLADGASFRRWDGERWTTVFAPVDGLVDLWGSSATDLYAVGRRGIIHHDGEGWTVERSSPTEELRAIWGASSDLVYAVGAGGLLLRRDRRGWRSMDSGTSELLVGVWADQGGALWTIGATSARRFDGRSWRTMATFEPDPNGLAWIGGTGAHDVWTSTGPGGEVRRHDGVGWATLREPDQLGAQPLWVDLHAVAVGQQTAGGPAGVARWFGAGAGPLLVSSGNFFDVWGSGPDDWIAVGTSDTAQNVAHHADGRQIPFDETVVLVTGFADGRAYAADIGGTLHAWDGDAWSVAVPSTGAKFYDLWTAGPADVYGLVEPARERVARVMRFDGERVTLLPPVDRPCGNNAIAGWSSGPDDVFVVGVDLLARYDGSRWTCHDGPEPGQQFFSVWGSGPGDVWAYEGIGESGQARLHHWNGTGWTAQVTTGTGTLTGTASDDVFLGQSMHFDGSTWTPLRQNSVDGVVAHATPSRLFSTSAVFESGGVGQFVRTRFWNGRTRERGCSDRVDDDGDGLSDGDDPDCTRSGARRP